MSLQTPKKSPLSRYNILHATPDERLTVNDGASILSFGTGAGRRRLTTLSVVALCYFNVSGGPIGSEEIMSSGGPLIGLLGLVLFPLFWCIPIALITAELSTAMPEDGGYTVWVYSAFGPFWGFQEGYWSWISGVIDNAIYPGLALSVITEGYGEVNSKIGEYFIKAAFATILALPGLFGIRMVGWGMVVLSILVMLPFIVMSIWALTNVDSWEILGQVRHENMTLHSSKFDGSGSIDIQWGPLINILFWNYSGFDGMSVFAGEVSCPNRSYPKALMISTILIIFTYLIPLCAAALFNNPSWVEWEEGSFSDIARNVGGNFLVGWIVVASVCSNAGMYVTELFVDSFQLYGMAESGLAPSLFKRRHKKYDTPQTSIYASLVLILILIIFEFESILVMSNAISALSVVLILLAALRLRFSKPEMPRPFKAPGGNVVLGLAIILPLALLCFIIYDAIVSHAVVNILIAVFVLVGFVYAYFVVSAEKFSHTNYE